MFKSRLFYMMIAAGFLALAVLLVYQSITTARVISATQSLPVTGSNPVPVSPCPLTAEEIRSIHPVWVAEIGMWVSSTDHGPTGVDGGMQALRDCPASK